MVVVLGGEVVSYERGTLVATTRQSAAAQIPVVQSHPTPKLSTFLGVEFLGRVLPARPVDSTLWLSGAFYLT